MPGFQQGVYGGVPDPGVVREPVTSRPGRAGWVSCWRGLGLRHHEDENAQTTAMLGDGPLGCFAEVVPEVQPVRNLDGLRVPD
ncbi:hypothetical protein GCM10010207_66150 [Streptomyces atratus]|nr:hypothetical protein GCM10010207_66150 [Streptomyces atratus]